MRNLKKSPIKPKETMEYFLNTFFLPCAQRCIYILDQFGFFFSRFYSLKDIYMSNNCWWSKAFRRSRWTYQRWLGSKHASASVKYRRTLKRCFVSAMQKSPSQPGCRVQLGPHMNQSEYRQPELTYALCM